MFIINKLFFVLFIIKFVLNFEIRFRFYYFHLSNNLFYNFAIYNIYIFTNDFFFEHIRVK